MSKRIDSHQHFWYFNAGEYSWIKGGMEAICRDFLPEHLAVEQEKIRFDGSIAVQARMSLEETEWLLDLSKEYLGIKGVVGYVDLCSPEVGDQLDRFISNSKLVGVRHVVHDEPDDEFMARPEFLKGLEAVCERGLSYDLLLFPKHLPLAIKVVERFPNMRFVLDHIGKPKIKDGIVSPWKADLEKLAPYENVSCKLSGMVTETNWGQWHSRDFTPYLDVVLDAFGPRRLMIGSDWPVCEVAGSYETVMGIVIEYVRGLSRDEEDHILGLSCLEWYGIEVVSAPFSNGAGLSDPQSGR